jgi:hypothetical protein
MKKITLLLAMVAMALLANATVYLDETFNYSDGSKLKDNSGWAATGTIGSFSDFIIGSSSLTYSNSGGIFVNSGLGKVMSTNYAGTEAANNYYVYKNFNSTAISTGTVYAAFLYTPNSVSQTQSQSPIISLSTPSSNTGVQVWVGKGAVNASNFRFGTTRGSTSGGDIKWASTEYSDLTATYFIVLKYDLDNKVSYIYINPTIGSASEPTADASDATSTSSTKSSLQTLQFKVNGASKEIYKLGNVRICSTWSEAVAAQSTANPLPAPSVGTPTDPTANGFTAHWSPVDHATGYDVKIYLGTNLVGTTNASGQATSNAAITGLMSGMTFTYQVVAKGDGVTYSDSDPSASSSEIKTLDPYATDAIHTDFNDGTWGTIAGSIPTSGSYPTYSVNGFDLTDATLCIGSIAGIKGESHVNRIAIDKLANSGNVALPTVNALKQIEIHATAGTAGNGFQLKEFNPSTNSWTAIGGTYTYDAATRTAGTDSIYIISLDRTSPTKLRIDNPTNGAIYIWQIITRNTNPVLLSKPVVLDASNVATSGATANWTPVENATGYKIYVYQGTTLIAGAPFSVNGQTINSFDIINLAASTTYSYKVQAIGDGDINYSDSFVSSAIEFSTVITGTDNLKNNPNITVVNKKIVCTETGNIHIYNMQGSLIESARNVKTIQTNLPSGIYIVKFSNQNGETKIQKISIQ